MPDQHNGSIAFSGVAKVIVRYGLPISAALVRTFLCMLWSHLSGRFIGTIFIDNGLSGFYSPGQFSHRFYFGVGVATPLRGRKDKDKRPLLLRLG